MTSMQRVLTTLGFQEPDRVPLFLLLTLHGAKDLGLSIREYFSRPDYVVEGQLRLRARFGHDCLYGFFYAPVEVEAFGGEVLYVDDGPPNSGAPFIRSVESIPSLVPPDVRGTPCLRKVLEAQSGMKARVGDEVPIIGVVMSPFSLPVMQLGFERHIELLYERRELFERLMAVNEAFCVSWANAQLEAGATAICYFDPVSSPTCVPPDVYRETGMLVAKRTLAAIRGPTATHFASGLCRAVIDDVASTGTAAIAVSAMEDLVELKAASHRRLSLIGNLNGIEMRTWSPEEAERQTRRAIDSAAAGGGFILSDNHGEIPYAVSDEVLLTIADTARRWGIYAG